MSDAFSARPWQLWQPDDLGRRDEPAPEILPEPEVFESEADEQQQLFERMQQQARDSNVRNINWDYIYEPDAQSVIDDLLVRYVEALVYQSVAENMASEQSARMVAMKAATDNAGNVINELKLVYNKTRQAAITTELTEIVAGAAAV